MDSTEKVKMEVEGDCCFVSFVDQRVLDEETLSILRRHIRQELQAFSSSRLVLDFSGIEGVAILLPYRLVSLKQELDCWNISFAVCSVKPTLQPLLRVLRQDNYFKSFPNRAAATAE